MRDRLRGACRAAAALALFAGVGLAPAASVNDAPSANRVLDRYLGGREVSGPAPGETVSFEIDASLPKLKKHGIMSGLRGITAAGRVAFSQLHFVGDEIIQTAVIAKFLTAQAKEVGSAGDLAIDAHNYRFHYKGEGDYDGRPVAVFSTEPRKRRAGLFKGELWLDRETSRPLREWGEFVKSPSIFLRNIYFVCDYTPDAAESHPRRIILRLNAAFAGPAELTMWLSAPEPALATAEGTQ